MTDTLHIVCLDAPSPPDYGGAIDMYYKIKALHRAGKKVVLHYFDYNPSRDTKGLEKYCVAIYAYNRKNIILSPPLFGPHIVHSRINQKLINRLNQDEHPVLLEGLHCSGVVPYLAKKERVIIRMHNEEASYYHHLANTETSPIKRKYFAAESRMLDLYQRKFDKEIKLACLSETDGDHFQEKYGFHAVHFIPCFIPWQKISAKEGKGSYCLYHGNLSVSENREAVLWLVEHVFSKIPVPFVIAGNGSSKSLQTLPARYANITLVQNPSIAEIGSLVQNAHIHVLPSMNNTGVKLKLLNALLNGRFCLTNYNGVKGSHITNGVIVQDSPEEWIDTINQLMQKSFSAADISDRAHVLALYNNNENARKLNALWSHCQ